MRGIGHRRALSWSWHRRLLSRSRHRRALSRSRHRRALLRSGHLGWAPPHPLICHQQAQMYKSLCRRACGGWRAYVFREWCNRLRRGRRHHHRRRRRNRHHRGRRQAEDPRTSLAGNQSEPLFNFYRHGRRQHHRRGRRNLHRCGRRHTLRRGRQQADDSRPSLAGNQNQPRHLRFRSSLLSRCTGEPGTRRRGTSFTHFI